MTARRELIEAVAARYRVARRSGKREILDEFVKVTGFHRKHAIRVLKRSPRQQAHQPRQRERIYNEAVREALIIVWEAADRICAKRHCQAITGLIEAMERHGHLRLDPAVEDSLLSMSAATMDRLLSVVRDTARQDRRRSSIAEIPELPGVLAHGTTLDQAIHAAERLAVEVVAEHVASDELPAASFNLAFTMTDEQLAVV